ncbi:MULTISPECIES: hypothetical protein [Alteromonadaceae]|jgi:hypothetical protein|uniref:Uncharacterized protein n=1 Tax=Brumicola blandensis TaxID=3075611 RepID=A0AAW8R354_9ALTE|nr:MULTISPECIES: hypothetical protein [unclassified Alteromonas]MDT0582520.1 hypothetical protein [Alteromonas sp. W409]MDT0628741.1 hypothetical protein [Alteromonas sp. W364]
MIDTSPKKLESADILTLFAFRYILDEPHPVINLEQDLQDLNTWPERLEDSYRAEWTSYIKKRLHTIKAKPEKEQSVFWRKHTELMSNRNNDQRFAEFANQILHIQSLASTDNITVLPTPLKRYLQRLLQL